MDDDTQRPVPVGGLLVKVTAFLRSLQFSKSVRAILKEAGNAVRNVFSSVFSSSLFHSLS